MSQRYYLLKVQLQDIEPAIWRRFAVPETISLDRLHDVIQIVMGWEDKHLHEFAIGKKRYTSHREFQDDPPESYRYRLGDLIKKKGRVFHYSYDFGDDWHHELTLENSRYLGMEYWTHIAYLDGARACPPEDVGGLPGYECFCEALSDPAHEEHKHFRDWYGGAFDPEQLPKASAINHELLKYFNWSRDRFQKWDRDVLSG